MLSGLLEILVSALMAPVTMVMQTVSIVGVLSGATVSWGGQRRTGRRPSLRELFRVHAAHVALGLILLATAALVPGTAPWLAVMILSLLAAPLLTAWSAGVGASSPGRAGLLRVPEEVVAPRVVARAEEVRAAAAAGSDDADGLRRVVTDGHAHAIHLAVLSAMTPRPVTVPAHVSTLVRKAAWDRITVAERSLALASIDFLTEARRSVLEQRAGRERTTPTPSPRAASAAR